VTFRPDDEYRRRVPYNDPGVPAGVIALAFIGACVLVGAYVGIWAGIVLFLAPVFARVVWLFRRALRAMRSDKFFDPSEMHMKLWEDWHQAARLYGEESSQALSAKKRYEKELVRFVRRTPA
jgi:hypothetical protein